MTKAQQGHLYQHGDHRVLAMDSGASVRVRVLEDDTPWLGQEYRVKADWLTPLPMKYFHGQIPQ